VPRLRKTRATNNGAGGPERGAAESNVTQSAAAWPPFPGLGMLLIFKTPQSATSNIYLQNITKFQLLLQFSKLHTSKLS